MDSRPLPLSLVETLFARLAVSYGHPFLNQYEGFDIVAIHRDWAEKLASFGVWAEVDGMDTVRCPAIDWALDNLPAGRPVNALDFRQLCKAYKAPVTGHPLGLPAPPRAVPGAVRSALAQLAVPLEDKRPERVRVAARCIAKWGCPGVRLAPWQREWLDHSREVIRRYEGQVQQDATREAAYAAADQ